MAEGGHPWSGNPGASYALYLSHHTAHLEMQQVSGSGSCHICTALRHAAESCGQDAMFVAHL